MSNYKKNINNKRLKVGLVGCGLVGQKRAKGLVSCSLGKLIACTDTNNSRAKALSIDTGAKIYSDWYEIVSSKEIDVVFVATTHNYLAEVAKAAAKFGKHVLVEKPAARNSSELNSIMSIEKKNSIKIHVGFNHRYHRSLQKARKLVDSGELGELMFIRGRYGHGGRLGYEKEWRANPKLSGGGELIDQGTHLIDLARWFLGDFVDTQGIACNYFWKMPVDDNGFMILKNKNNKVAFLHASCTEWKNLFSFEIYGKLGKINISGLGGSYGLEKITLYKMSPKMGPPETVSWEFPMGDNSWESEIKDFFQNIRLNRNPSTRLTDAHAALSLVESIYKNSGYDHNS
jgi:predicted dehydrogenase